MMMPADPGADLIMVQANLALRHPEDLLDVVAVGGHLHKSCGVECGVLTRQEVPGLRVVQSAHHEESFRAGGSITSFGLDSCAEGKNFDRTLVAIAHSDLLPSVHGKSMPTNRDGAPFRPSTRPVGRPPDESVGRDFEKVTFASVGESISELAGAPEFVVTDNPCVRDERTDTLEQSVSEFPVLLELDLRRDMSRASAFGIIRPVFRQVQLTVEEYACSRRRVRQEDAQLAVVDLSESATPLARDTDRVFTLLRKTGPINDEDTLGAANFLNDVPLQLETHVDIGPLARADEVLKCSPVDIVCIGNWLDRLALQPADEALQIDAQVTLLIGASEHGFVASTEIVEFAKACIDIIRMHALIVD